MVARQSDMALKVRDARKRILLCGCPIKTGRNAVVASADYLAFLEHVVIGSRKLARSVVNDIVRVLDHLPNERRVQSKNGVGSTGLTVDT